MTSHESPNPGRYNPKSDFVRPNVSAGPVMRGGTASESCRNKMAVLPNCVDTNSLKCVYPKTPENKEKGITEEELLKKIEKNRVEIMNFTTVSGMISFDKQSDRKFLPLLPTIDSRFESINYFPRISTKSTHSPQFNFGKFASRKESNPSISPGPYDIEKTYKVLYGFDMKKRTGRSFLEGFSYDTIDQEKVAKAVRKLKIRSKVPTPDFKKTTDRLAKSP